MATDVMKLVQSVVAEKSAIADRERQLIESLNRVLPQMGYRVVPAEGSRRGGLRRGRSGSGPVKGAAKTIPCPHCTRRFAHPLHLGRHVAAMHQAKKGRKRAAKKKAA
jgi:hypothetical protein